MQSPRLQVMQFSQRVPSGSGTSGSQTPAPSHREALHALWNGTPHRAPADLKPWVQAPVWGSQTPAE
jgi:hypothetical protein